jgi:hypothetical protein
MPTIHRKIDLFNPIDGAQIQQALRSMLADSAYKTASGYSADGTKYPDHVIPFVEKHLTYLMKHPDVNHEHYLANLRLMLKIKR